MARPPCCRRVSGKPAASIFKPAGIPGRMLEEVVMTLDEFEAIRLADHEGLYQEQAAERMNVSRPTFGRIIEAARRKIAEAVILGKALRIEGGPVESGEVHPFRCPACENEWEGPPHPSDGCPHCLRAGAGDVETKPPRTCMRRRRKLMSTKNQ
jgi:uncharacterized protein